MIGGLAKVVGAAAAIFVGSKYVAPIVKAKFGHTSMINGHEYALTFDYTTDPVAPVSQQQVQNQLDQTAPGQFDVLDAQMVPGMQGQIRQMTVKLVCVGPTERVPNATFLSNWPVGFGKVTLASAVDLGASPSTSVSVTVSEG